MPNYLNDIWDEPKGTLISKEHNKKITYEFVNKNIAEVLSEGESLLGKVLGKNIPNDKIPFGGIHINNEEKRIYLWYTIEPIRMKEWSSKYWKSWHIEFDFWGYESHYKRLGLGTELIEITKELENRAIESLKQQIVSAEKEPYFDFSDKTYKFKHREKTKELMSKEFEEMMKK